MYREIKFTGQSGYGLMVSNPGTKMRALVGIFDFYQEAYNCGQKRLSMGTVYNPRVVKWNKRNYNKYNYVFKK